MPTIAYHTLGCKLNFSETSTISRSLSEKGFEKIPFDQIADYYVINTCSVTENADKKFKQTLKSTRKLNPNRKVIAIGCYAQLKPEQIAEMDPNLIVLGAQEKFNIEHYLEQLHLTEEPVQRVFSCEIDQVTDYQGSYSFGDRTRAFVKIQDGCDYKCTYCTIPLARGKSRSDTIQRIIQNVLGLESKGVQEIILTGVNTGDFGANNDSGENFLMLLHSLIDLTQIKRIRISSIEPNLFNNDIIDYIKDNPRIVPHFHIPLQSGSDIILKKMKRRYLTPLYIDRIAKIRKDIPHACIGVDVIVGFPTESPELFKETYSFLNELDISYLHVFSFSDRDNTEALDMTPKVSSIDKKERSKMLHILSEKKRHAFYVKHQNETRPVLFEDANKEGYMYGYTDNYIRVKTYWNPELLNKEVSIKLTRLEDNHYFAPLT